MLAQSAAVLWLGDKPTAEATSDLVSSGSHESPRWAGAWAVLRKARGQDKYPVCVILVRFAYTGSLDVKTTQVRRE